MTPQPLPTRRTRVSPKARKHAEAAKLAVAVLRVSTDKQERSGLGLEAQREAVQTYCQREGLTLVAVYSDTASGTVAPTKRPGMASALGDLAELRAGVLVTAKADRLSRSNADLWALMETSSRQGWCIRTADGVVDTCSESGRLMAGVAGLFADLERKLIAARTKDATEAKRERGDRLGAAILTPEATRQRIRALLAAGSTMQATAATLNAEGIPTATGRSWTWQNVQRVRNSLAHDDHAAARRPAS
jgi:DNA invertase Pin-like site-specific DNA recombinase